MVRGSFFFFRSNSDVALFLVVLCVPPSPCIHLSLPSSWVKRTMALVFRLMFLAPSGVSVERQTLQDASGLVKQGIEG